MLDNCSEMVMNEPLILTLALDQVSSAFFNARRQQFFPPSINYLNAHLTLFHHLPQGQPEITMLLDSMQHPIIKLEVTEVVSIGKGVVYKLESSELRALHNLLGNKWQQWLTPQDKHSLWPHVTVQNKVTAQVAKQTLEELKNSFTPFVAYGLGLNLYVYKGGPWQFQKFYSFGNG